MSSDPFDVLLLAGRFEVRGSSKQTLDLATFLPTATTIEPAAPPAGGDAAAESESQIRLSFPRAVRTKIVCLSAARLSEHRTAGLDLMEVAPVRWPVVGPFLRRYLLADVLRNPPDLIHIQGQTMHELGRWLARRVKRPYVLTLHREPAPRDRLRLDRVWGRGVVAVTSAVREAVLACTSVPQDRVRLIRNGVSAPGRGVRRDVFSPGRRAVVGTAGPLEAGQGLEHFIHAIPRILSATLGPDWNEREGPPSGPEFLIAGSGPDEAALRRLTRDLRVDARVTFVSNLFDFAESLSAMDLFCLPAERPGMGVTMLEAMSRGIPVIATDVGPVTHVVEAGQTGLLIPPASPAAIAEAVTSLLHDVPRALSLGQAGQTLTRERFPLRNMLEDTLSVYAEAAGLTTEPADEEPAGP